MLLTVSTISEAFVVGAVMKGFFLTAPLGWFLMKGGTIGDSSSGASLLASTITKPLYTFLWNNLSNTEASVSTGRGATAVADFAAHKTITIPDMRQRFAIGKADSGTGSVIGGTGGVIDSSMTVDPPSTASGNPSATKSVISNITGLGLVIVTTNVASDVHNHNTDIASMNVSANNPPFLAMNFIIKY